MSKFIKVTVVDGCKALLPISNIEYVAELSGYENSNATIYFKADCNKHGLNVKETFDEIVSALEAAGE